MNKPRQQFKGDHAAAGRKMDTMHGKTGGNTSLANDARPRVKVYPAPANPRAEQASVELSLIETTDSHAVYGATVETKAAE